MKRAIITGVYGQDGSYLSEILSSDNYEVYGVCRAEQSIDSKKNKLELLKEQIKINEIMVPLNDYKAVKEMINNIKPDVVFHMAAIHRSSTDIENNSVNSDRKMYECNVSNTHNILAACYENTPKARIVVAGSCLMFDACSVDIQDEDTLFSSQTMYGIAKIAEQNLVSLYRQKGLFASMPILYNHESHRRAATFITKKIADGLKEVRDGERKMLELGSIDIKKDWGYAGDYAEAMKRISENNIPRDYIIATGELHSISEFIEICASKLKINDWRKYITINPDLITRRADVVLRGNPRKCITELGWKPTKSFDELVDEILK